MQSLQARTLFVVKILKQRVEPLRELTAIERLQGWCVRDGRCVNEGHQAGMLHSVSGPHVLTWDPKPGDEIVAALPVEFEWVHENEDDPNDYWLRAAACEPVVERRPSGRFVLIRCKSVRGRRLSLGEDADENDYGHDVIADQLRHAIDGDWSAVQCDCEVVEDWSRDTETAIFVQRQDSPA